MTARKPFYITTAISYPNGAPHIGHAYELLTTDVIARFKRLDGFDVRFLTGVDDHGQKMVITAKAKGTTAPQLADEMAPKFQEMGKRLNASNDDFIRTIEPRHERACQAIWSEIAKKGDIYKGGYSGWYSVRDEAYYNEDELTLGEGGQKLAPTGTPVEWMEEQTYFFKLSAYADRLLAWYDETPDFIQPLTRRNEITAFIKRGLNDLSISRARTKLDWGIAVPGDDEHVMYVWIDALTNYITALGYPDTSSELFQKYWPADVHIIGKDIVRFHAIIWPAMLMSAGLALPKRVFGHGFLNNRGEKMSKSVGNVIDPLTIIDTYGVDQVRYFFCREVPYGQDGSYSHEMVVNRVNADLANDIGNLAQRSLSMINKNCGAQVPSPAKFDASTDAWILAGARGLISEARASMEKLEIHKYVETVFDVVSEANRYFAGQEPWALKKTDSERMATILYVTAEVVRVCALMLLPVMPDSINRLLDLLAVPNSERTFAHISENFALKPGTPLPAPSGVFPRLVDEEAATK